MTNYKSHYACFKCRKTFKRRLWVDVDRDSAYDENVESNKAICPECGSLMVDMGLDFESPKKTDVKTWKHIEDLYKSGITFHSCGCTGPGYIPKDREQLIKHLMHVKDQYIKHMRFWKNRIEPQNDSEKQKDWNNNAGFLFAIPQKLKEGTRKKRKIDSDKAVDYWTEKLIVVENRLSELITVNKA